MSPFELLEQYHTLRVSDPRMDLSFTANIWMYVSGGNSYTSKEYNDVMSGIAVKLGLKGPSLVPNTFYIPKDSRVDSNEPFFKQGIRRAFAGRGSPEEITDAVRLAWLTKKCKPFFGNDHWDPKKYTEGWFGQDCNAFVGNYQGISPNCAVFSYAKGYGDDPDKIPGATECVKVSSSRLPLPILTDVGRITQGTVIVTYGPANSNGKHFRHIAVVQSFSLKDGSSSPKAMISIAEWGQEGGISAHAKAPVEISLKYDATCGGMGSRKLIGWSPKSGYLRFFLDASPLDEYASRGWSVCGKEGL